MDDKTKITDLCIFNYTIAEVPQISPQNEGFILVQVETPDQAKLIEKLMINMSCTQHETLNLT